MLPSCGFIEKEAFWMWKSSAGPSVARETSAKIIITMIMMIITIMMMMMMIDWLNVDIKSNL